MLFGELKSYYLDTLNCCHFVVVVEVRVRQDNRRYGYAINLIKEITEED